MRRAFAPLVVAMLVVLTLSSASCGPSGPSDTDVLTSLADEVAVPAFQSVAEDMARLEEASQALCRTPDDASLEAAQQTWRDARASWMRSEAVWFGPVMDRRSRSLLDWSPTDVDGIEELLVQGSSLSANDVGQSLASNQRGFGAIEYIVFDSNAVSTLADSPRRCSYLTALTEVARGESDAILAAWVDGVDGSPPYGDYLTGRSGVALLGSAAVAEVVRTQVFLIRDIVDMRLASALGLRASVEGQPDLSAIPGTAADNGLQDLRHELEGMRAVYEGSSEGTDTETLGISDLVRPLSDETDQRLREQLAAAIVSIDSIEGPLRVALSERSDQVQAAYELLADLQLTMATELVSLLGVSVGFTDTDGDTLR